MRYRLKAYSSLSLPRPKSSRVHWSTPTLLIIRHGSTTVEPMTAVCGEGSLANLCSNRGSAASQNSSRLHQARRQHQPGCHPPPRICNAHIMLFSTHQKSDKVRWHSCSDAGTQEIQRISYINITAFMYMRECETEGGNPIVNG